MIVVRVMGEGQFEVDEAILERLNELDNQIVEEVAKANEQRFHDLLHEMIELVKREANPLHPSTIVPSDIIIPPADLSLEEAKKIFKGEGIIPD